MRRTTSCTRSSERATSRRKCKPPDPSAETCKEKFLRIHEFLLQNLKKEERLKQEAKDLKGKLQTEINKYDAAMKQKKENNETLKQLQSTIAGVKKEMDSIEEKKSVLKNDIQQLENDKIDLIAESDDREQKEKDRLVPEIARTKKQIEAFGEEQEENKKLIQKKDEESMKLTADIEALDAKKEELKEELDKV